MSNSPEPLHPALFSVVSAAVCDALAALRGALGKGAYVPTRDNWPRVEVYPDSGMPCFNLSDGPKIPDYSMMFGQAEWCAIDPTALPAVQTFVTFISRMPEYLASIRPMYRDDLPPDELIECAEWRASGIISRLVDKYQSIHAGSEYSDALLLPLYLRWEEEVFAASLPVEVVVPLLMLQADFTECSLGPNVVIWKMDNDFQRARFRSLASDHNIHRSAAASATHALVIQNRVLKREQIGHLTGYPWEVSDHDVFPMPLIESAFAALRLATDIGTGYAQVILRYRYRNSKHDDKLVPTLHTVPVRKYPMQFDHWRWLQETPCLTTNDAERVARFFQPLKDLPGSNTLAIAARRINDCLLRDRQDDALLDAAIAFETLLSDDGHQEMTHKLAMRVAALMRVAPDVKVKPQEAFQQIKDLYGYRSKLVHGKDTAKELRNKFSSDPNRPVAVALFYLRIVMRVLLENPCYRKATEIDRRLILGDTSDAETETDEK